MCGCQLEEFIVVIVLLFLALGKTLAVSLFLFVVVGFCSLWLSQEQLMQHRIDLFGMHVQGLSMDSKIRKRPVSLVGFNIFGGIKDVLVHLESQDTPRRRLQHLGSVDRDRAHVQNVGPKDKMQGGRRSRRTKRCNASHGGLLGIRQISVLQKDQGGHDADAQKGSRDADLFQAADQVAQWRCVVDIDIKSRFFVVDSGSCGCRKGLEGRMRKVVLFSMEQHRASIRNG